MTWEIHRNITTFELLKEHQTNVQALAQDDWRDHGDDLARRSVPTSTRSRTNGGQCNYMYAGNAQSLVETWKSLFVVPHSENLLVNSCRRFLANRLSETRDSLATQMRHAHRDTSRDTSLW
jgi:hypothetical protein